MKCVFLLLLLLMAPIATAEQYRWSDDAAVTHYADALSEVPPRHRKNVTIIPDQTQKRPPLADASRLANAAIKKGEGERAIELLLPYAKQGNARIQYRVGHLYHKGKNVPHKMDLAFFWYSQSAEGGYHQAQFMLGSFYERGTGTGRDYTQAIRWYERATKNGSAYAPFRLGFLHEDGRGLPKNQQEADRLFMVAAERGYTPAAYKLGIKPPKRGVNVTNREDIRERYRDGRIVAEPVANIESPPKKPSSLAASVPAQPATTPAPSPARTDNATGEPDLTQWLARLKAIDADPSTASGLTYRPGPTLDELMAMVDLFFAQLDTMDALQESLTPPGATPPLDIPSSHEAKESAKTFGWIIIGLVILNTIGWWRIFSKGGRYGFWALIPLINFFPWLAIARKPAWWFLLLLIPGLGFIFYLIVNIELAHQFGRGTLFGLGLTLLPFLFAPLLGLGPSQLTPTPTMRAKA